MTKKYYYLIMSQKELFKNQVIEEILRERSHYYLNKNINKDFWLLISPNFIKDENLHKKIENTNFYKQQFESIHDSNINFSYYVSIVSTNFEFIKWIKLRIGFFEQLKKLNLKEKIKSDGIYGYSSKLSLKHNPEQLHPDLLIDQYIRTLKFNY